MEYFIEIISSLLLPLLLYYLTTTLLAHRARQTQIKQHACLSPPSYPHTDPLLGYDLFKSNMQSVKTSTLLQTWLHRFQKHSHTFSANFLGVPAICTVDPLNLQTIMNANFKDYGVQPLRREATLPFLGEGVFTMDGEFWEHSRTLIRPTFNKTNIANLPVFEVNLKKFMDSLPRDGSTVDLKPLLCKLVCFPLGKCAQI